MPILVALVVLVTALGLLNLLLLLAMLRRMRSYETRLSEMTGRDPAADLLPVGTPLPTFPWTTATGEAGSPTGLELVAFLSAGCDACEKQLPRLERFLIDRDVDRNAALVVVASDDDDPVGRRYVDRLGPLVTVVQELPDGPIGRAFGTRMYPTFYLVSGGAVRSAGIAIEQLAEPVPA